jgi:hypothetical protein
VNPGGDFSPTASGVKAIGASGASYTWSSTVQMVADVQSWLNNSTTNFGWLLQADELQTTAKRFASRESAVPTQRPLLTIAYTEPAPPQIVISDATVTEGNAGTTAATFTVTLDTAVDAPVRVSFATADNTATCSDNDYATASGTLDFTGDAGETHTVTVLVQGDTHIESDEFFLVDISSVQAQGRGVRLADNQAQGTIINDDRLLLPNLSIGNSHVIEGDEGPRVITLTVTLDTAANGPASVDFATADGTATGVTGGGAGSGDGDDDDDDGDDPGSRRDYLTTSGTLHFVGQAGETLTIEVLVYGDEILEVDEQFFVDLTNPIGATVRVGRGIGTILDDESPYGHKRWHNELSPLDVDDDESITAFDALLVINEDDQAGTDLQDVGDMIAEDVAGNWTRS